MGQSLTDIYNLGPSRIVSALVGDELLETTQSVTTKVVTPRVLAEFLTTDLTHGIHISGAGAPVHTPTVLVQDYTDTDDGTVYHWYAGAWH